MPLLRALLWISVLAAPLSAQRWSDRLSEGQRLRVQTRLDGEYQGAYRRPVDDSLRIVGARGGETDPHSIAFALIDVTKVDVSTAGSPVTRGFAGLVFGAVVGGLVGAVLGNSKECAQKGSNKPGECYSVGGEGGLATALYGFAGAGAGALLGGLVGVASSDEGWAPVYVERAP